MFFSSIVEEAVSLFVFWYCKRGILSFNMPCCNQICIAKCLALIETFCMEIWDKPLPEYAKSPLPLLKCIAQKCVSMFPNFTSQLIIKTMTKYLVSKFSSS